MNRKFSEKVKQYAYKLLQKEKDKWESGMKNALFQYEDAYHDLVDFLDSKKEQ